MVIYISVLTDMNGSSRHGAVALAIAESEVSELDALGTSPSLESLGQFVMNGERRALFAALADTQFPAASSALDLCIRGVYRRLTLRMSAAMHPARDPESLFFWTRPESVAVIQHGIDAAVEEPGVKRHIFVGSYGTASPGLRLVEMVCYVLRSIDSANGVPKQIESLLCPPDRPSGWIHYTLRSDCRCPGCNAAWNAVLPPPRQALHDPPARRHGLGGPSRGASIRELELEPAVFNILLANMVTSVKELEAMPDRQLYRFRNIGRKHVAAIRKAIAAFQAREED